MFDLAFDFVNVHDDICFNLNCHFQEGAAQKVSFVYIGVREELGYMEEAFWSL